MNHGARKLLNCFLALFCLLGVWGAGWEPEEDYGRLCRELQASGYTIVDSGVAYGVPFVKINIPRGFSITSLCRRIPSFSQEFTHCRNRIAFFNALNPSYIKTKTQEPFSIEADTLKIPLDLRKVPEIFPANDESLAGYDKYLLVDIGKGYLALYERDELRKVFPISAGTLGQRTPLLDFRIEDKDENHWSNIYESWMPWALHIKGPYYIHGGVLPGKMDSAGCIRLPMGAAEELFQSVDVGTSGRIIDTPKVEQDLYPAPFCR